MWSPSLSCSWDSLAVATGRDFAAGRIDEADDGDAVLDQIVVEVEGLAVLGQHGMVGHVAPAPARALAGLRRRRPTQAGRQHGGPGASEAASSTGSACTGRLRRARIALGQDFGRGEGDAVAAGIGRERHGRLRRAGVAVSSWMRISMAKSSCTVLWQWLT